MNPIRNATYNAWNFLWTEIEPEAKPLLLSVADRILNPISYTEINSNGFPIKKTRQISRSEIFEIEFPRNSRWNFNSASIGLGIFGAHVVARSLAINTYLPLLAFTAISFSANILAEKALKMTEEMHPKAAKISQIALRIINVLSTVFFLFYLIATYSELIITFISSMSFAMQKHMEAKYEFSFPNTRFMLATNIMKFIAFNFFAGAFLKFLAYKIYPAAQNAYNNFFSLLKAGEIDLRGNRDIVLRTSFNALKAEEIDGNKNMPTLFGYLPFDILPEIRQFLSSTEALKLRSCNKVFFYLTSNQDFLKMRINENYIFKTPIIDENETTIKLREKINKTTQDSLLLVLNTYPLDPRLTGPSLNFIMEKDSKIYWKKTPDNKTECGKILNGKPFFTKDFLELKINKI